MRDIATAQPVPIILDSASREKPPANVLGVIPARLASTRLARKVLRIIAGRPMLAWVYEAASACPQLNRVVVATDSDEVAELCHQNHWPVELTSTDLPSGTDRVHAISQLIDANIYVNIQGDEPLLRPEHLTALLRPFAQPHVEVSTLKVLCTPENIANPNAVKVVTAADGRALYFSRATIPYDRDHASPQYWKHIGLYAYRKATLQRFPTLPPSALEQTERLEQLRFLESGINIHVEPTDYDTIGVDTEEDLIRVESLLRR
jgi:3-deoxy-manno-octulosonate cytidylyltransferase (CMP-KDO synthetase)